MQLPDFDWGVHFFVVHAPAILLILLAFLVLIFAINHWRERKLIKQMEGFLSPNYQDILVKQEKLMNVTRSNIEPAHQAVEKAHVQSVLDLELEVLKREMNARLQARKKN